MSWENNADRRYKSFDQIEDEGKTKERTYAYQVEHNRYTYADKRSIKSNDRRSDPDYVSHRDRDNKRPRRDDR